MNANTIALNMWVIIQSYSRNEISPAQLKELLDGLKGITLDLGIEEAVNEAYRELSWRKHQARLHNYEAPANG